MREAITSGRRVAGRLAAFVLALTFAVGTAAAGSSLREKIVKMAASQIGLVKDARGPDGFKIGWRRLVEFYQVAYDRPNLLSYTLDGLKKVGGRAKYAANWCGIFGVWAARKAGVEHARWGSQGKAGWGPVGFGKARTDIANMRPGDIVVFKGKLIHHAVVERIDGATLHTIDGNGFQQQIQRASRPLSKVWYYYRTVPEDGAPSPESGKGAAPPGETPKKKPAPPASENHLAYVTHPVVSVKSRASASAAWRAALRRCQTVRVLKSTIWGKKYAWSQVEFDGKTGYVARNLLSRSVPNGCKPATPPPPKTAAPPPVAKRPKRRRKRRRRRRRAARRRLKRRKHRRAKKIRRRVRRKKKAPSTKAPPQPAVGRVGYIAKYRTVLLKEGAAKTSRNIGYLGRCQRVTTFGSERGPSGITWVKVRLDGGKTGYVASNLITTIKTRCR